MPIMQRRQVRVVTTSTRALPLLVPDTGVRYLSDVFTGDAS